MISIYYRNSETLIIIQICSKGILHPGEIEFVAGLLSVFWNIIMESGIIAVAAMVSIFRPLFTNPYFDAILTSV
jgi:hypothetical protein